MGMYDEVICEYPLPGTDVKEFQTKNFENLMFKYIITEEGRLIEESSQWEFIPEEERPYYGKPEWETNPIVRIFGSMKTVNLQRKDMDFHGIMTMYTMTKDNEWVEFAVKFTDGNVVSVNKINVDP